MLQTQTIKKSIRINKRFIILEGVKNGNIERFSVTITNPIITHCNLSLDNANRCYRKFIELSKKTM